MSERVINYYTDPLTGLTYKKIEEKQEIVPVPRREKPDPLRDRFHETVMRFAPVLSDIMGEYVAPEAAVPVMFAVIGYIKNTDADDDEERIRDYHDSLRACFSEKIADAFFKKTRHNLDKLTSVFDEPKKEIEQCEHVDRDDQDDWER